MPPKKVFGCFQLGPFCGFRAKITRLFLRVGKLTWNLKMELSNRRFLLETTIFRFYVKFRGSKAFLVETTLGTFTRSNVQKRCFLSTVLSARLHVLIWPSTLYRYLGSCFPAFYESGWWFDVVTTIEVDSRGYRFLETHTGNKIHELVFC